MLQPPTSETVLNRAELLALGFTPGGITRAVRAGRLRRLRRDHYVAAGADRPEDVAVRVGGRLGCVSLLIALGVFVLDPGRVHIHVTRGMSRMRSPRSRRRPLRRDHRAQVQLHWWPPVEEPQSRHAVHLHDAIAAAIRCQTPRAAIATLDSLLFLRIVTVDELAAIFSRLPTRFEILLALADGRCESGPESFMRLLLRQAGAVTVEAQVVIDGVGRVDFLIDGWLIVECDSRAFHEGWTAQLRDRRRDLAAAALGYSTLRPVAEDIFSHPDQVLAAVRGLLASR